VTGRWIPDAFRGTIASLLRSVHSGIAPETSFSHNCGTVELIDALYRSVESGEAQTPG
jgi:hypothetical protein